MIKSICLFLVLVVFSIHGLTQNFSGNWQGALIPAGDNIDNAFVFYADFEINDNNVSGSTREESYNTDLYSLKKTSGEVKNSILKIKQDNIIDSKRSSSVKWCRFNAEFKYDSTTGYLTGTYTAYDCKRNSGKIILYKAENNNLSDLSTTNHLAWFKQFVSDYKNGFSAPLIREKERDEFVFEPVFFDFDKAEIRPEHEEFLNQLIRVVKGHSDLRVKVVGHTDADGTDSYNDDLSKRRAQAIIDYFVKNGLSPDRLEFDFKGEHAPIDTNSTSEGKQRNRRVDFSFI